LLKGRVAVVGVGSRSHGDDGAGPLVVDLLNEAGFRSAIDCGTAPELETWRIREMHPNTVVFVDAVDFGGKPGDVAVPDPNHLRGRGMDTHRMPLKLTMQYLEAELGAKCLLLAIQPKSVAVGCEMCAEVRSAAVGLANLLRQVLIGCDEKAG
jgi:hydrogenase 3 maturation protease